MIAAIKKGHGGLPLDGKHAFVAFYVYKGLIFM